MKRETEELFQHLTPDLIELMSHAVTMQRIADALDPHDIETPEANEKIADLMSIFARDVWEHATEVWRRRAMNEQAEAVEEIDREAVVA